MDLKILAPLLIMILGMASCRVNSTASQPLDPSTANTVTPMGPPTQSQPTATVTSKPVDLITATSIPTSTIVVITPPGSDIPVFPGARDIYRNYTDFLTGQTGNTLYFSDAADIVEIEMFYMHELVSMGWEWVYTEIGESLVTTVPAPTLIMEFKKEQRKLGIAAVKFGNEFIVLGGIDTSGTQLATGYIGGIAGGFDLMGPSESDIKPGVMRFSSTLLEFTHPSDWLATDQLINIFKTDKAINYYPNRERCAISMDICFVTFSVVRGFHFDHPVSIRVHLELVNMTLQDANEALWDKLTGTAQVQGQRYRYPEDLAQTNSFESLEVRMLTLGDGTPAIQRVYRWKQNDVDEFIVSSYTLFISKDILVEFHTDFTSAGWSELRSTVGQVISSMKVNP